MASLASGEKRCLAHVLKNQESSLKHDDSLSLILRILLDNCDLAHVGARNLSFATLQNLPTADGRVEVSVSAAGYPTRASRAHRRVPPL